MIDRLVEDIVEVTETLIAADLVDIEALAHPAEKPSLHERLTGQHKWRGWGKWGKEKADEFRAKMKEQQNGPGVFRRGVC
jgi:hypothetical protein